MKTSHIRYHRFPIGAIVLAAAVVATITACNKQMPDVTTPEVDPTTFGASSTADPAIVAKCTKNGTTSNYLYVMNADGSHQTQISTQQFMEVCWSPDGKHLALGNRDSVYTADVSVVKGTPVMQNLTFVAKFGGAIGGLAWNPATGSTEIAVKVGGNSANNYVSTVQTVSSTGGTPTTLWSGKSSNGNNYEGAFTPSYSPDGNSIAFLDWDNTAPPAVTSIVVMDHSTGVVSTTIDVSKVGASACAWAPGSGATKMAVCNWYKLYTVDAADPTAAPVTVYSDSTKENYISFRTWLTWSPDATKLLAEDYNATKSNSVFSTLTVSTGGATQLTTIKGLVVQRANWRPF